MRRVRIRVAEEKKQGDAGDDNSRRLGEWQGDGW
jgi:hypothetical protein